MSNTMYTSALLNAHSQTVLSVEDEEEFITQYIWLIGDKSGSIKPKEAAVYSQISQVFSGLAEVNKASTDIRVRVKLALFNGTITNFNDVHLDPQQLADTFTEDDFRCSGSTSASAVSRYIDKELSRSSPVVRSLKKNSPGFTFVIITDGQVNDPAALREDARKVLESNRFYQKYCRVLVVFLGNEADKATAVAMADGHEENVVALGDDLVSLLGPVIIGSTVTFADGTHLNSTGNRSVSDLAEDAKKRSNDGTASAGELEDQKLRDELMRLMGKVS